MLLCPRVSARSGFSNGTESVDFNILKPFCFLLILGGCCYNSGFMGCEGVLGFMGASGAFPMRFTRGAKALLAAASACLGSLAAYLLAPPVSV